MFELDFRDPSKKLKEEYLVIYDGIQLELLGTMRFDENLDLSTTYVRRVDITRASKIKVEETFPISEQGYTVENSYWMEQNVTFYWMQELAKYSCQNHTICNVGHLICYHNSHLKQREFKYEMDN